MSTPFFTIKVLPHPLSEPWNIQQQALKDLCFYKERSPEDEWEHDDIFCGKKDRDKHILAMVDTQIIGSITTLKRKISFEGKTITLGGIGGVCTHPNFRRRGVSSALLQMAMTELKKAHCDLAYLCTDIDGEGVWLYSKAGFVPLGHSHTYLGESGKRYTDTDGMIAPVCSPEIFNQVLKSPHPFDIGVGNW